ncbi:MAG TPA: 5-formyltetrahydrofolate cyclo-ligase [Planctomycetaceae bacterium]|nr:5-formyltetrahydrofolate cyclo-ligase [Planctomycetaceae bacterium]
MNAATPSDKQSIREKIRSLRIALDSRPERSQQILDRLIALPRYQSATNVLAYVGQRSEVQTLPLIEQRLRDSEPTFVPWCDEGRLKLFRLESLGDLESGSYEISEPRHDLRSESSRIVPLSDIDVILVPGIAFDRSGGRLGQGKGYYDKLLQEARPRSTLIGLAFDCQIVDAVPREPHDVPMDLVVTESSTIVNY